MSLLISADGVIQVVYFGPANSNQLISDATDYGRNKVKPHRRAALPGRWYYRTPRNLRGLGADLKALARTQDAAFYEKLSPPRKPPSKKRQR